MQHGPCIRIPFPTGVWYPMATGMGGWSLSGVPVDVAQPEAYVSTGKKLCQLFIKLMQTASLSAACFFAVRPGKLGG